MSFCIRSCLQSISGKSEIGGLIDFSDRFLRPSYPSTLNVVYTVFFLIEWKSAESSKHNVWTHYDTNFKFVLFAHQDDFKTSS